jgi:hypothetical protein
MESPMSSNEPRLLRVERLAFYEKIVKDAGQTNTKQKRAQTSENNKTSRATISHAK